MILTKPSPNSLASITAALFAAAFSSSPGQVITESTRELPLAWDVDVVADPDAALRTAAVTVATSDSVVLDEATRASLVRRLAGPDRPTAVVAGGFYLALAAIFAGTALIANMTTNAAAAAVMFPISVSLAGQLEVNYMPFAMTLMMGASAFISPTAYQTNLMVYQPGGYQFTDFMKIGLPLTILVGIVTVIIAPLVFGF